MTAVYWILVIVGYLAIAVVIMRWRTARINAGKRWSLWEERGASTKKEQDAAHKYTPAVGLFWPAAFVYINLGYLFVAGLYYIWLGIDWMLRKIAGLPPR